MFKMLVIAKDEWMGLSTDNLIVAQHFVKNDYGSGLRHVFSSMTQLDSVPKSEGEHVSRYSLYCNVVRDLPVQVYTFVSGDGSVAIIGNFLHCETRRRRNVSGVSVICLPVSDGVTDSPYLRNLPLQ
ncbi:hypothetical protein J6590_038381 [Homalodisca vitripennis]|nr:hypothetical protein J6590_038381 [Homalodisca vitripennis]